MVQVGAGNGQFCLWTGDACGNRVSVFAGALALSTVTSLLPITLRCFSVNADSDCDVAETALVGLAKIAANCAFEELHSLVREENHPSVNDASRRVVARVTLSRTGTGERKFDETYQFWPRRNFCCGRWWRNNLRMLSWTRVYEWRRFGGCAAAVLWAVWLSVTVIMMIPLGLVPLAMLMPACSSGAGADAGADAGAGAVVDVSECDDEEYPDSECPICMDNVVEIVLPCSHSFCRECAVAWQQSARRPA